MTELALNVRSWGQTGAKLLLQSFAAQWFLFVIPCFYLATNTWFFSQIPHHMVAPFWEIVQDFVELSLPVGLGLLFIGRFIQYALFIKPESLTQAAITDVKNIFTKPAMIVTGLPLVIAMFFYNKAMIELKPEIPTINPFKWDETFVQLDRTLHFGIDPWRLLQPIMGYAPITFVSNLAYDFWFLALFGSWVWFAFQKKPGLLRTRFFISYMLIWWIGGGLLAVAFSSAGPCYFGNLGLQPNPYVDLMSYLNGVNERLPIWALDAQKLLWDGYTGKSDPLGISAFPSMHNASAVLFALTFRQVSKAWGRFFAAYAVLILLTSVHLGWHFAVDGYAAIILAFACWFLSAPIARHVHAMPAMKRYQESLAAQPT